MNAYNFEVIGDKLENPEDPNTERKEDGFPVQNVELLIGYWTCRGPLTGGNLHEYLSNEKFKDHPENWSQDEYNIGQFQVHRSQFFLEPGDILDVIKFLYTQRGVASQTDKETVERVYFRGNSDVSVSGKLADNVKGFFRDQLAADVRVSSEGCSSRDEV